MARRPALPPGTDSRSMTVTSRPAAARCSAQARPPRPAPTITTRSVRPVTFRITSPNKSPARRPTLPGRRRHGVRTPSVGRFGGVVGCAMEVCWVAPSRTGDQSNVAGGDQSNFAEGDQSASVASRPGLAEAYARSQAINREHGRSYYLATRLLPAHKRPHVYALYGFTR